MAAPTRGTGAAFHSVAHLAGRQPEVPPRFRGRQRVETQRPRAGRKGGSLRFRLPLRQRSHPTPGSQKTARASPSGTGDGRGLLSAAPTPREHPPQQCTAWATPGRAAATALAQFPPDSRQAGCQHGKSVRPSVCLSAPTAHSEGPAPGSRGAPQPRQLTLE